MTIKIRKPLLVIVGFFFVINSVVEPEVCDLTYLCICLHLYKLHTEQGIKACTVLVPETLLLYCPQYFIWMSF